MTFSDPVANMLASINNANLRFYRSLSFPFSNLKWEICKKFRENNFLSECWIDEKNHRIKVKIKYSNRDSNIHQLKKISKPSQHIH
jgi:ribosomal protein S8